jgi:hypothetical protein
VRVPNNIDLGKATVTVTVPAWKNLVTPLKVEVPIVAEKPMPEKAAR